MPRRRATEASWDSDEDLLEDDGLVEDFTFGKEDLDEIDEDALLGGSDDETGAIKPAATTNDTMEEEDLIELNVHEADDLEELGCSEASHTQLSSRPHEALLQDVPSETETCLADMSNVSESNVIYEAEDVALGHDAAVASDEESDSENEHSHQRGRFLSERLSSTASVLPSSAQTGKTEKRDIPDTLEISREDQEKIEKFMMQSHHPNDRRNQKLRAIRPTQNCRVRQSGISRFPRLNRPPMFQFQGRLRNPAFGMPFFPMPGRHLDRPFGERFGAGDGLVMSHLGIQEVSPRHKILVNPHFRNAANAAVSPNTTLPMNFPHQPGSQFPSLMSLSVGPPPAQQQPHYQSFEQHNTANNMPQHVFIQQGQGQNLVQPRPMQSEMRMFIQPGTPATPSTSHSGFIQQFMPVPQQNRLQQPPMMPTNPTPSFSNQMTPVQMVYSSAHPYSTTPVAHRLMQPSVQRQSFVNQQFPQTQHFLPQQTRPPMMPVQSGINVQFPQQNTPSQFAASGSMFPMPNSGLLANQTSPLQSLPPRNDMSMSCPPPGHFHEGLSNRLRHPVPEYTDFSGDISRVKFKPDFHLDPEIVGQPIETVVRSRPGQGRAGDGRVQSQGLKEIKKNNPDVWNTPQSQNISETEVEQQKKLAERARRFAAAPSVSLPTSGRIKLGKRLSDQSQGVSGVKQMKLMASRKVVARATAMLQQQNIRRQQQSQAASQQQQQPTVFQLQGSQAAGHQQSHRTVALRQQVPQPVQQIVRCKSEPVEQLTSQSSVMPKQKQSAKVNSDIKQRPEIKETVVAHQLIASEAAYDAELQAGLEVQKKLREQIMRRKELRRKMQASQRQEELLQRLQMQSSQSLTVEVKTQTPSVTSITSGNLNISASAPVNKILAARSGVEQPRMTRSTAASAVQSSHLMKAQNVRGTVPLLRTPGTFASSARVAVARPRVGAAVSTARTIGTFVPRLRTAVIQQNVPATQSAELARSVVAVGRTNRSAVVVSARTPTPRAAVNIGQRLPRSVLQSSNTSMPVMRSPGVLPCRQSAPGSQRIVIAMDQKHPSLSRAVSIEGLSTSTTKDTLQRLAERIGPVQDVQILMNEQRAVVRFLHPDHAKFFVAKFDRHMMDLSMINVSLLPS